MTVVMILFGVLFVRWTELSWLEAGLLLLASGLAPLGYAAWGASNDWHGLIRVPRVPWVVSMNDSAVHIQTHRLATRIPLDRISSASLITEWSFDLLKGVEIWCLVLQIRGGPQISIPGSSAGFDALTEALKAVMPIPVEEIGKE